MKTTGADVLLKTLKKVGVTQAFAYSNSSLDSILQSKAQGPDLLLAKKPENTIYMANGFARTKGKTAVAIVPPGAGAAQILPGLLVSHLDSLPILCITAQVPHSVLGTDAFQESNTIGITQTCTKHNYLVRDYNDLPQIIEEAYYLASSGRPGPIVIDIPHNFLTETFDFQTNNKTVAFKGYNPIVKGHSGQIKKALQQILQAKSPMLYLGGGVALSEASQEILKLAETLQIPVAQTLTGIGSFPTKHPLNLGLIGKAGKPSHNTVANTVDVLVAIGTRFNPHVLGKTSDFDISSYLIHIDIDPAVIATHTRVDLPIVGDVKTVIKQMIDETKNFKEEIKNFKPTMKAWQNQIETLKNKFNDETDKTKEKDFNHTTLIQTLSEIANEHSILTCAKQDLQVTIAKNFEFHEPKQWCPTAGLEAYGSALSAAIGAQTAHPDSHVFCITTHKDFLMNMAELFTVAENQFPIFLIVIKDKKEKLHFADLTKQLKIKHYDCKTLLKFKSYLKTALKSKKPTLLECEVKS